MAKCKFRSEKGKTCQANAQVGMEFCIFHDPARSADVQRARKAGGIRRAQQSKSGTEDNSLDLSYRSLRSNSEVAALLEETINRIRYKPLDLRAANSIGYLAGILLKALERGSTEDRLAHLEAVTSGSLGNQAFNFTAVKGDEK